MTKKEFLEKHHIKMTNMIDEMMFFAFLDYFYIEHTKEQAVAIIEEGYDHADDFYNESREEAESAIENLKKLFGELPEDKEENADPSPSKYQA